MSITFGSLFTGIGGFDLGFERAGMVCKWQCEIDKTASSVLAKHWHGIPNIGDVRNVTKDTAEPVDLICGGFPCQDVSLAGERLGLEGKRSTLWKEFARIICDIEPEWVVVENVYGLLSSDNGKFFGGILRDLAEIGFDATWNVLRASDFGAIHRRERVILIANHNGERVKGFWEKPILRFKEFSWCKDVGRPEDLRGRPDIPFPIVRRKSNGVSSRLDELGNAVVPQLAEWIGKRIIEAINDATL